ncbi:MAG: hypothetical protein A3H35_19975 [Betaproteobacteria bacterium RIFCSPLOWO2_02_FULL_62_17]|nr:MAG: hypothetical protein A3H35_19975 [Betaproteobacteria bacterium RIFCSPLOWO2_02_FULL_62_17]
MTASRAPLLAALALAALAGLAVWGAWSIPQGPGFSTVGPRDFPLVLSGMLAVFAIAAVVQALRGRIPDEAHNPDEPPLAGALARMSWMIAGMLLAPLGLHLFGFFAGGVIGFATVARAFGARNWAAIIGWAAASTIVVWLLFDKVLTLKLGNELLRLPF